MNSNTTKDALIPHPHNPQKSRQIRRKPRGNYWLQLIIVTALYTVGMVVGLKLQKLDHFAVGIWPASGIILASMLLLGIRVWPAIPISYIFAPIIDGNPFPLTMTLIPPLGEILQAIFAVKCLEHFQFDRRLNRLSDVFKLIFLGAIIATQINCTLGTLTICVFQEEYVWNNFNCLSGVTGWINFINLRWNWWLGNAMGILIFTPLILLLYSGNQLLGKQLLSPEQIAKKRMQSALLLALIVIVSWLIFFTKMDKNLANYPVEYFPLPLIIWATLKYGSRVSVFATFLVSIISVLGSAEGGGPFIAKIENISQSILLLQTFMGVITITTLVLSATVSERTQAEMQLQRLNQDLENRVYERTLELEIAKEKAEVANKAKSTFIANMSHELRTPLNAVLGFSQIMTRDSNLTLEQKENLSIINNSGEYLLTLINNILDLSKIEAGKIILNSRNFDLYNLLIEIEDMLIMKAEIKNLELKFNYAEDVPRYIFTDETKLRQVLINFINNAIKFTKKGGVYVQIKSEKIANNKNYLLFTVEDTGAGIAKEELKELFEAFTQTKTGKEADEGTGLGLPISRQFVQLMGGDIKVESEVGIGSKFSFNIEVKIVNENDLENQKTHRHIIALEKGQPSYRILIVDDKIVNRKLLIKLLQPLGFELKEASNGKEAIEIWDTWQPHLIWLDMRMPIMDGYEATKHIKSTIKGNATAVIALTASVLEEEKAVVLSAGCDDFIRKPFHQSTIFETMSKHLGVRYLYDDNQEEQKNSKIPEKGYTIKAEDLTIMSAEWLEKFKQAAIDLDDKLMLNIIQEIPPDYHNLAQALTDLVENFRIDKILNLIQ